MPDDREHESLKKALSGLEEPIELIVFIASGCPHCPKAVREAGKIARANPLVTTKIVDAQASPDLAERFNVKSVPMTVLGDGLSLVGVVKAKDLAEQIMSRQGDDYGAKLLISLVDTGRLDEAASRIRMGPGADQFADVWQRSSTSLRIGLMMVAGKALEKNPSALDGIVQKLSTSLRTEDAALRGDTADLLGQIGHPDAAELLKPLLDDPNSDVADIASEALEEIRRRMEATQRE